MERQRFANLDALRGVCALTVMLFHCGGLFAAGQIFCHGYLAVDIFFILSGFVIAHGYEQRLAGGLPLAEFLRARLNRLAPVYWAGTALCAAAFVITMLYRPAGAAFAPGQIVLLIAMALALVPQLAFATYAYPVNLVAWSLAGEWIANLVWARWLVRQPAWRLGLVIAAGWGSGAMVALLGPGGWDFGALASDFYMVPFRAVPAFLAGVLLLRAHRGGMLARLPDISPLIPLLVWVLIACVPASAPTPLFDMAAVMLAGPLLIALLARGTAQAPRFMLWLGAISYPLYASHRAMISLALETPLLGFARGPNPMRAALLCAAALMVAALLHWLVERPRRTAPALMEPARLT